MSCFSASFFRSLKYCHFIGAIFLLAEDAKKVFDHLLKHLPDVGDNDISSFADYMRSFWLPKLKKMSCWDDEYPRTTNQAETYHRKLADAFGKQVRQLTNNYIKILARNIQISERPTTCTQDISKTVLLIIWFTKMMESLESDENVKRIWIRN